MQLAPSAFLASAAASASLVASMLPATGGGVLDMGIDSSIRAWQALSGMVPNVVPLPTSQRSWDAYVVNLTKSEVVGALFDGPSQARLKAVMSQHSDDWLLALPLTTVGLRLSDEEIRNVAGLRLGTMLCTPHLQV